MRTLSILSSACLLAVSASLAACGDDDDDGTIPAPDSGVVPDGSIDSGVDSGIDSGVRPDSGTPVGDSGPVADTGAGSMDAGPQVACDLGFAGKPEQVIPNPTGNITLTSDKVWKIEGITYVGVGNTLTIEPCTRIEGKPLTGGVPSVLVVERGAKINAAGTAARPILFTGEQSRTMRAPGLWGGVVLLGRAPTNVAGGEGQIEGLANDPKNKYGGSDAADNSGVLTYARIEDSGYELAMDIEVNGLTLGGVGTGTVINHIMVVNNLDDCFEFFGGTVNADHLIAEACGDDHFDADVGYSGTLDTLLGRKKRDAISSGDPNGFEFDGNRDMFDAMPFTNPKVSKATLCSIGVADANVGYGALLRRGVRGAFTDTVITGFDDGVSVRDASGTPAAPNTTIASSTFFGNFRNNIGAAHSSNMTFDPNAWFTMGAGNTAPTPGPFALADCQAATGPTAAVTGSGVGAFKTEANWAQGAWVSWTTFQ